LNQSTSQYVNDNKGKFSKIWFWFKSIQSLFAKVQTKIRKEKGERKEKEEKGPGGRFQLQPKNGPWPS
jgi:hypothetical protein